MLVVADGHAVVRGEYLAAGVHPHPVHWCDGGVDAKYGGTARFIAAVFLGLGTGQQRCRAGFFTDASRRLQRIGMAVLQAFIGVERHGGSKLAGRATTDCRHVFTFQQGCWL